MSSHYHVITYSVASRSASDAIGTLAQARTERERAYTVRLDDEVNRGATVTGHRDGEWWRLDIGDPYAGGQVSYGITACTGACLETAPTTVRAEVWALSADEAGIWLVSGLAPWRSGDVLADTEPHEVVRAILREHRALGAAKILHSTSWRPKGTTIVLAYVAALSCEDVLNHWPGAQPVSLTMAAKAGNPETHAADDVPIPRDSDVLLHALRHLRFLLKYDATARRAMSANWRRHLAGFEPALAGMYEAEHVPEVISETG